MAIQRRNPTSSANDPSTRSTSTIEKSATNKSSEPEKVAGNNIGVVDVLRVLGGILLLSSCMSYLATGESLTWGWNPWFVRFGDWKALIQGQVRLTDEQLLAYDGTDPKKPIYLALNGTIYDVSISPQTYGPGGSYHHFAGRDCARAFITGCFGEDQTADLRGVEEMYVPIDDALEDPPAQPTFDPATGEGTQGDPVVEAHKKARSKDKRRKPLTKGGLKKRREQEHRLGRRKVEATLEGWHKLFRGDKGKKYFKVGEVIRDPDWLEKLPRRELCEQAKKSRPKREDVEEN